MASYRIIKKYPNRRLYDTKLGTYITLEDIKQLVFDCVDFQIIDVRTKKDITQNTLMQIIAEQEASATPIFTTDMLQDFIRFYHEKSHTLLSQYLQQAMRSFIQQKVFFKKQFESYEKMLLDPSMLQEIFTLPEKMWPVTDEKIAAKPKTPRKRNTRKNTW